MSFLTRFVSAGVLTAVCFAGSVEDHVVAVQGTTVYALVIRQVHGNGICIDNVCSVVATVRHLQELAGKATLNACGSHTAKVLSLAAETDSNKTDLRVGRKTISYNVGNDISFIYTKKGVRHKSGFQFSYAPHVGQMVTVVGFHNHRLEVRNARIIASNLSLAIGKALLRQNLLLDIALQPGGSGSAVVDEQGHLLGMIVLTGSVKLKSGDLTASLALPVSSIAQALFALDAPLAATVFSDLPTEDAKPLEVSGKPPQEGDLPEDASPVVPELTPVPTEVENAVEQLRSKAEAASSKLTNFVAKQCLMRGTQKALCHELTVIDGHQRFRALGTNGTRASPTDVFSPLKHGIWTQSDWSDALGEVADNPWVFQGSLGDHYVFTFNSRPEDDRCYFEEYSHGIPLFGWRAPWKGPVECFEIVLTDKEFNVVSQFTEMRPQSPCLITMFQTALYYEWITLAGTSQRVLLPVMERITAKVEGQTNLWYSTLTWTDYQKFRANSKIDF
jgi:hypothetical protein